jgi:ABC-type multidrug transport system fused ATPase/permease subunit
MSNYVDFLIQLTEKDKRLLIALFIILILFFVLIAYVGQGIRELMKKYSKGIDGYMHELCSAKLIDNPKDFRKQVFRKESKVLYKTTRWFFRVFIVTMIAFVVYTFVVKPSGDAAPFAYVGENLKALWFDFEWPKGSFFGIDKFPVDWPYVKRMPSVEFTVPSIVSYVMLVVWVVTFFGIITSTLRFIARINRAKSKSVEVFSRSLDDVNFSGDNFNL